MLVRGFRAPWRFSWAANAWESFNQHNSWMHSDAVKCDHPATVAEEGEEDLHDNSISIETPKGAGRKKYGMKVMKRLGMSPAAQSLMTGYRRVKTKSQIDKDDKANHEPAVVGKESSERIVEGILAGENILDEDFSGKGQPISRELLESMLEQLNAIEAREKDRLCEGDAVLDSDDPSIDYVNVVSEIRALSRGKTSVKWLGKRKSVSKKEMEGVDCSRDYDFQRGAFESPDQAKFKKPLDDDSH